LGLSNSQELQIFLFVFFVVSYVGIVFGNLLIVTTVASDSNLHSPMYFLLANLSVTDLSLSSVTAHKMLIDFFNKCKAISFKGCLAQIFLLHFFGGSELLSLLARVFDRYVATCNPYSVLQLCAAIYVLELWLLHGELASSTQLIASIWSLLTVVYSQCSFILLIISYTIILMTIQHHPSNWSSKVLSTLTAHITVILLFFGPCIFIHAWPFPIKSLDKFLAVFYSVVTPLLNPMIYTLRNKDMKTAMSQLRKMIVNFRLKV
uniref:Olfactory receptor 4F17-like n=1 Tax=Chinchilla lanigera TaxID=34839 RepID=A0A8C2YI00_CHILA